ncbi:Protein of unknown function [Gryllus bimaculatus]|nr:Protein of unknown function [Gryllus bimaculatus]
MGTIAIHLNSWPAFLFRRPASRPKAEQKPAAGAGAGAGARTLATRPGRKAPGRGPSTPLASMWFYAERSAGKWVGGSSSTILCLTTLVSPEAGGEQVPGVGEERGRVRLWANGCLYHRGVCSGLYGLMDGWVDGGERRHKNMIYQRCAHVWLKSAVILPQTGAGLFPRGLPLDKDHRCTLRAGGDGGVALVGSRARAHPGAGRRGAARRRGHLHAPEAGSPRPALHKCEGRLERRGETRGGQWRRRRRRRRPAGREDGRNAASVETRRADCIQRSTTEKATTVNRRKQQTPKRPYDSIVRLNERRLRRFTRPANLCSRRKDALQKCTCHGARDAWRGGGEGGGEWGGEVSSPREPQRCSRRVNVVDCA